MRRLIRWAWELFDLAQPREIPPKQSNIKYPLEVEVGQRVELGVARIGRHLLLEGIVGRDELLQASVARDVLADTEVGRRVGP